MPDPSNDPDPASQPKIAAVKGRQKSELQTYQKQQDRLLSEVTRRNKEHNAKAGIIYHVEPPFPELRAMVLEDQDAYSNWFDEYQARWNLFVKNKNQLWSEWTRRWEERRKKTQKFEELTDYMSAWADDRKKMQDHIEAMQKSMLDELEFKKPKSKWLYINSVEGK